MHPKTFAKHLRHNMTESETQLWRHLRAHRLDGSKFKRQQPIGPYIVDFIHFGARLIIEADGGQHNTAPSDQTRDTWLRAQGFTVLRFWNNEITTNLEGVLTTILAALNNPTLPSPETACRDSAPQIKTPLPSRERGRGEGAPSAIESPPPPAGQGLQSGLPPNKSPSPPAGEGLGRGATMRREPKPQ